MIKLTKLVYKVRVELNIASQNSRCKLGAYFLPILEIILIKILN